jgi:hypothetical protein
MAWRGRRFLADAAVFANYSEFIRKKEIKPAGVAGSGVVGD